LDKSNCDWFVTNLSYSNWFSTLGAFIGFITNNESLQSLWTPMTMLNIWRIPILFYVSGMGLFLAMQNRNWKQLFKERFKRIGIPLVFGALAIVPIHLLLVQNYYGNELSYKSSIAIYGSLAIF
jgi:hypothetical protein